MSSSSTAVFSGIMPWPIPPHLASSEAASGELSIPRSTARSRHILSPISFLATVRGGNCQLSSQSGGRLAARAQGAWLMLHTQTRIRAKIMRIRD